MRPEFVLLKNAWIYGTLNGLVLEPILGFYLTSQLYKSVRFLYWILGAGFLTSAFYAAIKMKLEHRLFWVFIFSWTASILLTCWVREWGVSYYASPSLEPSAWTSRSSFQLAPVAVLFWAGLLSHRGRQGVRRFNYPLFIFAILYIFVRPSGGFHIQSRQTRFNWLADYPQLESSIKTGCPKHVMLPTEPNNWFIDYKSPRNENCEPKL